MGARGLRRGRRGAAALAHSPRRKERKDALAAQHAAEIQRLKENHSDSTVDLRVRHGEERGRLQANANMADALGYARGHQRSSEDAGFWRGRAVELAGGPAAKGRAKGKEADGGANWGDAKAKGAAAKNA